jgi:hypothetical protein
MKHTSRQDTKITLGQLAPRMMAAETAYMADDVAPINALMAELPGNPVLERWADNLQKQRAEAGCWKFINSINAESGCAR